MARVPQPVPRWAVYVTWVLSVIGLGFAIYLTYEHFTQKVFQGCPDTGIFNCQKVTTSAQSRFLGIPVAVLGLVNYAVLVVINSPWVWRLRTYWVHVARVVLLAGSMVFVLWLFYAELVIINNFCYYCTGVHIVTFFLFVIVMIVAPRQLGWERSVPVDETTADV